MAKRIFSVFLMILLCISLQPSAFAHDKDEHYEELEYVLFGNRYYKDTHPVHAKIIQAIEDATYLAIDQFNGQGTQELDRLRNEGIPDLPSSIAEINFSANYSHRFFTHRGWNVNYDVKSHWEERRKILNNTVNKELFSSVSTPLDWFPWLQEAIYGKNAYEQQCENFCILVYYVHILGDHIEAGEEKSIGGGATRTKTLKEKTAGLAYVAPLANTHDRDNPGIIPDLIKCFTVLFKSQSESYMYRNLMQDLQELRERSERVYYSTGGVNTEEKFEEYNACAKDLLEVLAQYVPEMLKKEEFFKNTFQ